MINDDDNINNNGNVNDNGRQRTISGIMTDRETIVLETMFMQKSTKESLKNLDKHGFPISKRTLRRDKEIIREKNRIRLYQLVRN